MKRIGLLLALSTLFLLAMATPEQGKTSPIQKVYNTEIAVEGNIYIWSLEDASSSFVSYTATDDFAQIEGGKYIPARGIYAELESLPITTADTSTYSNEDGSYFIKKSNLVEGSTYDADVEVRAEAILETYGNLMWLNKIYGSVYNDSSDIYATNGQTRKYSIHTGDTQTIDIYIGGPLSRDSQGNSLLTWDDDEYWNIINEDTVNGRKIIAGDNKGIHPIVAFWITQVMQDCQEGITRKAPSPGEINWNTSVIFPSFDTGTHYTPSTCPPMTGCIDITLDNPLVLFPSQGDSSVSAWQLGNSWKNLRGSVCHEFSHKVMHQVYGSLPTNKTGDHAPNSCSTAEKAIMEGFAEFLPAAINDWPTTNGVPLETKEHLEYNNHPLLNEETWKFTQPPYDLFGQSPAILGGIAWHKMVTFTPRDFTTCEGEVAAVFWDIYDPQGWEYMEDAQQAKRPAAWTRMLTWNDRVYDGALLSFWDIIRQYQPSSLREFWNKWIQKSGNDLAEIHGLKAILFNRSIDPNPKPENPPTISNYSVDPQQRKMTFQLSDPDTEDRNFLYYNFGYQKNSTDELSYAYAEDKPAGSAAQDGKITFNLDIPRGKLGRKMILLAHDSMQPVFQSIELNLPEKHYGMKCGTQQITNFANGIAIQGNYAYVADMEDGLVIYDLSDPNNPRKISQLSGNANEKDSWSGAMDVAVSGNYAYIAAYSGALVTVDISNPAQPTLRTVNPLEGIPSALTVSGNRVYIAIGSKGVAIASLLFPASPFVGPYVDTPGDAFDVAVFGNVAAVAAGRGGLQILRLGVFPYLRGGLEIDAGDLATSVAFDANGLIYLGTESHGVQVYDISSWNPAVGRWWTGSEANAERASPIKTGWISLPGRASRLTFDGLNLYVAHSTGVSVVDTANPELLYIISTLKGVDAVDVAQQGELTYVAAGSSGLVTLARVTSGEALDCNAGQGDQGGGKLTKVGEWQGSVRDMAFFGFNAFVASWTNGVKILDFSNFDQIQEVGSYNQSLDEAHPFNAMGIDFQNPYAYVTSLSGDLHVLNLSIPSQPHLMGMVDWNRSEDVGTWSSVDQRDDNTYVCAGKGGVRMLNTSDPNNLPSSGVAATDMTDCTDVIASYNYMYALGFETGLHVYRTLPKTEMTPIATWSLPEGGVSGIAYHALYLDEERHLLYVAANFKGLYILDVSDPPRPQLVGSIDPGKALDVAVQGNYAYVGDEMALHVIDIRNPVQPVLVESIPLSPIPDLEISAMVVRVQHAWVFVGTDRQSLLIYRIEPE
jgi:hypothetical protein